MASTRIKGIVEVCFTFDPENPKELIPDPEEFLEAMLSTMDEVGQFDVSYSIYAIKDITHL